MAAPIWNNVFGGTCLLVVMILLLRKIFGMRLNPNIRYFLWSFVALRILLPVHFEIALPDTEFTEKLQNVLPFVNLAEMEHFNSVQENAVPGNNALKAGQDDIMNNHEQEGMINLPLEPEGGYAAETLPLSPVHQGEVVPAGVWQGKVVTTALRVLWLCGVLGITAFFLIKNVRFYAKVKENRKQVMVLENGLWVYEVAGLNCLLGCVKPAIYLSPEVLQDEKLKEHVLKHELQHYRVRDNVWTLVRTLCLILQWYNPLVWAAYFEAGKDCELACDYRVTRQMSQDERVAYGESLLKVVSVSLGRSQIYLATSMGEDKKFFSKRLEVIMKNKAGKMFVIPCVVILLAGIVAFSTITYSQKEDVQNTQKQEEVQSVQKQEEIDAEVEQALQQAEEEAREQYEAELEAMRNLLEQEERDVAAEQALREEEERLRKEYEAELKLIQELEERVNIQKFSKEDMTVIPEVPQYTYEEAIALGTVTELHGGMPGASEGMWYIIEVDGIEYYFGKYDFRSEEESPEKFGFGYSILSENYVLTNGLKVGMSEEEVLERYPNMIVQDFEGNYIYDTNRPAWYYWNGAAYPGGYFLPENEQYYSWTDQFDYIIIGDIDQGTYDTLPVYVGLLVKDKVVKAITFYYPTAS